MKTLFLFSLLFTFVTFSCSSTKHLVSKTYLTSPSQQRDNLLVFLPGRGSDIDSFEKDGLLKVVQTSGVNADCVSIDATLPYYIDRSLLPRMESDVFSKAELTNYRNLWLIGNSMGTIGALLYVLKNPGRVKGLILLGPYLGEGSVVEEVEKAGRLSNWTSKVPPWTDYMNDMWSVLKTCVADKTGKEPRVFVLTGKEDRFRKTQDLLIRELPPNQVFLADGGHDWPQWNRAMGDFLGSNAAKKAFTVTR